MGAAAGNVLPSRDTLGRKLLLAGLTLLPSQINKAFCQSGNQMDWVRCQHRKLMEFCYPVNRILITAPTLYGPRMENHFRASLVVLYRRDTGDWFGLVYPQGTRKGTFKQLG